MIAIEVMVLDVPPIMNAFFDDSLSDVFAFNNCKGAFLIVVFTLGSGGYRSGTTAIQFGEVCLAPHGSKRQKGVLVHIPYTPKKETSHTSVFESHLFTIGDKLYDRYVQP